LSNEKVEVRGCRIAKDGASTIGLKGLDVKVKVAKKSNFRIQMLK
jgi:hypothetical protein